MICSNYKYIGTVATTEELSSQPTGVFASQITFGEVYIKDTRYTDASTFTTAMDGVQLCYELATPQTIQLTTSQLTTLAGYNTIYTDIGNITLQYFGKGVNA